MTPDRSPHIGNANAALVDAFYMALKANGGDQNAAKAAQREKAVQWNAVEVFNEIYA